MPELPEVETVRAGLDPVMTGRVIARAEVNRPDLRWPFPKDMRARLERARIDALGRRSKYLLAHLSTGETLIIHLGMSGRLLIQTSDRDAPGRFHHDHPAPQKHDHVVLTLDDGVRIVFNDPRRFGAMDLAPTPKLDAHWLLSKLGPEPLGNAFGADHLKAALKGRRSPIKSVMLDQKTVAGLGNIYVCEALWRSGISPVREAARISARRIGPLADAVRETLADAIAAGGSSLRDYRQADGELGYFQHSFAVYDREGETCLRTGCGGKVKRIVQSGRSSFYCSRCQR